MRRRWTTTTPPPPNRRRSERGFHDRTVWHRTVWHRTVWRSTVWRSTERQSDQGHDRDDAERRGPVYPNIANTANAYAKYINARGGIAGRPPEVTVCDEQFDPAVAATCARQAVEEGMVSVVGSFTFFAESIVPVIAESNITWFGECCPIAPTEFTDPHSFPTGNQPLYAVGPVTRAINDGCKKIIGVIIEGADAIFRPS